MLHHVDLQKQSSKLLDRRCQGQIDRRQAADQNVLHFRAVEPLKDLIQLFHRHALGPLPAYGPAQAPARFPATVARG